MASNEAEFHPPMKPLSVIASIAALFFLAASSPTLAQESKKPDPWLITVTRTHSSGAELSRVAAPMVLAMGQSYRQILTLNMATKSEPRFWRINFHIDLSGPKPALGFEAGSLEILQTTYGEGNRRSTDPVPLFASMLPWKGAGTYPLFSLDGEAVTATFRPDTTETLDGPVHKPEQILEIIRKDRLGRIASKASCPWAKVEAGRRAADLALWAETPSTRRIRWFSCSSAESNGFLTITAKDFSSFGDPVTVFVSDALLGAPTRMQVYRLDDEVVEARIGPGGAPAAE